ncbi:Bax inhibitor-1/YccA family protein [Paraliomyxa miuraensis]|uniref:Bax inhibitor-1/YccA family protein n=1 Tax=Paraliomyxa miuraensis TaxID=376150 RepID=UPI0022529D6A|nr:Bax inhibitor-1/YccA family protein [Paraliomyxa miuraensis]MCX4243169.1 Bax inhibitor-1/YccA family protein [Paraliomyxa miuraensis]
MQGYQQQPAYQPPVGRTPQLHTGVSQFMNGVYAWMTAGVAVTAAVAYGISQSPQMLMTFFDFRNGGMTGLGWVAMLAPIGLLLIFGRRMMNMSRGAATAIFMVLAVCYGITFSLIPLVFAVGTIFKAFVATMGMFGAMAAFGYLTKKDLTGIGQFLLMALFGIIIASLVNVFFVKSAAAHMAIDVVVVLVFAGLTAYDTQKLKQIYLVHGAVGNIAILGALNLYLDFINIFIHLLSLFGSRD